MIKNDKIDGKIRKEQFSSDGFMSLETSYEKTVEELGLQQTKRDQIIGLYLSILGFVIPNIINLDVPYIGKGAAFIMIYIIGILFTRIVIRYRIYKEVYWISCRVISQLYNIKDDFRNKETVQSLFFRTLDKNKNSVVSYNQDKDKINILKTFKLHLTSAEFTLFNILLIFSSFIGFIGVAYFYFTNTPMGKSSAIVIAIFIIIEACRLNCKYIYELGSQYQCVFDNSAKSLSKPFNKAWMLHCYVDDDEFEIIHETAKNK